MKKIERAENNGTWEIDQINKEIKVRKTKRS